MYCNVMYYNYYITVYTASTQIVYKMHMDVTSTSVLATYYWCIAYICASLNTSNYHTIVLWCTYCTSCGLAVHLLHICVCVARTPVPAAGSALLDRRVRHRRPWQRWSTLTQRESNQR